MKHPPTPPCFTHDSWVQFLDAAQATKDKPFAPDGSYRAEFNYCQDCTLERAVHMGNFGKCSPWFHRSKVAE